MNLNGREVDANCLEIGGVDHPRDYPKFCDAYFSYAEYAGGEELTGKELDQLTDKYPEEVNMMAHESLQ